jgi:hypothetical protein
MAISFFSIGRERDRERERERERERQTDRLLLTKLVMIGLKTTVILSDVVL